MTAAPDTLPAASLWEELRAVLRIALQVFGEPHALFDDIVLPRAEARRLAAWIGSLEAVARALLAVLAASLPQPARTSRRAAGRTAPAAEAGSAQHDPLTDAAPADAPLVDDAPPETPASEAWAGVAFRVAPRTGSGGGPRGAPGARRFLPVRGLALRLEALIRVAQAPEPFARRLARRLRAEPGLARRILRRPKGEPGRPPPYDELVDDALACARAAVGAFAADTG